jgi:hypothetical protein
MDTVVKHNKKLRFTLLLLSLMTLSEGITLRDKILQDFVIQIVIYLLWSDVVQQRR